MKGARLWRWGLVVWLVYGLVWIALEGALWQVLLMGVGATGLLVGRLGLWWGVEGVTRTAVLGLLFGLGSALLTLFFMVLKTGLHAHGPEFTPQEINWVWGQLPVWAAAGGLAGLGVGFLRRGSTAD